MFGLSKPKPALVLPEAVASVSAGGEQVAADTGFERTAALEAELEAIEAPADVYRIIKDHKAGSFVVQQWRKWIDGEVHYFPISPPFDGRAIVARHVDLCAGLPTHKAAEAWLKAYLDPTTNHTCYDAEGKRIEVAP